MNAALVNVRAEEPVPVGEIGGIVAPLQAVVDVVVRGPSHAWQQPVQSPWQVVAAVVLHCQPAVEEVEEDLAQRMAAHHPSTAQGQQQQRQQLSRAGILGCQGKGEVVLVVHVVDVAVQPGKPDNDHTGKAVVYMLGTCADPNEKSL